MMPMTPSKKRPFDLPLAVLASATFILVSGFAAPMVAGAVYAQSTTGVNVSGFAFNPSTIIVVVSVNNTVTWTNHDQVSHTVTADDNSFSGSLPAGGSYSHTFTAAGTYTYHCAIHPYMKGSVVVRAGSSSTASTSTSTATSTPTSSSAATSTPSAYGSGGIPEFPFQGVAVVAIAALVVLAYLSVRRAQRS